MSNLSASRDLRFEADELFDEGASGSQAALMIGRLTKMAQTLSDERLMIVDKVLQPLAGVGELLDELTEQMHLLKERRKAAELPINPIIRSQISLIAGALGGLAVKMEEDKAFADIGSKDELNEKFATEIEQALTQTLTVLLEKYANYFKAEQFVGISDELRFFFASKNRRVTVSLEVLSTDKGFLSVNEVADFDNWKIAQINNEDLQFKAGELSKDTIFDIQRCQADINGDIKFRKAVKIDENGNFIDAYLNNLNARIAKFYCFQGDLKAVVIDDLLQLSRLDKELSKLAKMIKQHQ